MIDTTSPIVWTTQGNVNADRLVYSTRWEVHDDWIKFVETYALDDVVVRESAHVLSRKGLDLTGQAAVF